MPEKVTIEVSASPYYVQFMAAHPMTGEILFPGDVALIPDHMISEGQRKEGVFARQPDGTPENRVPGPRSERSQIVGYNISESAFEAQTALAALGDQLPPALLAKAREEVQARRAR